MPSGSKKRKTARQKQQQLLQAQTPQPTFETSPTGQGYGRKHGDSSSSDGDKDIKENINLNDSWAAEVFAATQEAVGDHGGIRDSEVVGNELKTVLVTENEEIDREETEVQRNVENIVIEVKEAGETLPSDDSLSSHEIQAKPVPVFDEAPVSELLLSLQSGNFGERVSVTELLGVQETDGFVDKHSVSELPPQSHESDSVKHDSVGENNPVKVLNQPLESRDENNDRYLPTAGGIIEHRVRFWNCCGLIAVFTGSRDDGRT